MSSRREAVGLLLALLALLAAAPSAEALGVAWSEYNVTVSLEPLQAALLPVVWSGYGAPQQLSHVEASPRAMVWSELGSQLELAPASLEAAPLASSFHRAALGLEPVPRERASVATDLYGSALELEGVGVERAAVCSDMHGVALKLGLAPPRVEEVAVSSPCGAGLLCAGLEARIVVKVSGEATEVSVVEVNLTDADGNMLVRVVYEPPTGGYRAEGPYASYVTSVSAAPGDLVIEVAMDVPWELNGTVVAAAEASNPSGSSSSSASAVAVNSLEVKDVEAPESVAPGEEFNVTMFLVYAGTDVPPPPGTPVAVDGEAVTVGSGGSVTITLTAPEEPGVHEVSLVLTVDPTGQEIPVSFSVVVSAATAAKGAAAPRPAASPSAAPLGGAAEPLALRVGALLAVALALVPLALLARRRP